jgi:hypothetical protein
LAGDVLKMSIPSVGITNGTYDITVTAANAAGLGDPLYTGTVHFTSNDAGAILPANYTFTTADHGTHTFTNALKFTTTGSKTVTVSENTGLTSNVQGDQTDVDAVPKRVVLDRSQYVVKLHNRNHVHRCGG